MTDARDKSGWLPNLLGPVVLKADGTILTPRGTINFKNSIATDDEENDTLTIEPSGNGDVVSDTAYFGDDSTDAAEAARVVSRLFRVSVPNGGGDVATTIHTLVDNTDVDVTVTTVYTEGGSGYFRDHRFRGGRSGGTSRTTAITESTADLDTGSDFDDGNDYAVLTRSGNDLVLTLREVPGSDGRASITVTIQPVKGP